MRTEKDAAARKQRADAFWNIFLFTKDGKVKSTLLVNSFSLSVLFLAVYVLSYFFLIDWIDKAVASVLPVFLTNVLESVLPAVAASLLCSLLFFVFREKRLVPLAHLWLLLYALVLLIGVSIGLAADVRALFWRIYAAFVLPAVFIGGALSVLLYRLDQKRRPAAEPLPEKKPWEK